MKNRLLMPALLTGLLACGPSVDVDEAAIVIDGSSTVYPIVRQGAELFMLDNPDVPVAVNFSGTTAGFRLFCDQATDISAASRAINADERALCEANGVTFDRYQIAIDAVAIVTHRRNTWIDSLTFEQLQRIWSPASEGAVETWQDVDPAWPDRPLSLYGRGQDSGTFDFFTTQLGELRQIRQDHVGSEDEEFLALEISEDRNSLGYFGLGAYHRHWEELRLLGVDSGDGPEYPSLESVSAGNYAQLTRPLYIYVRQSDDPQRLTDVSVFLTHFFEQLPQWIPHTGYLPMPPEHYRELVTRQSSR